MKLLYIVTLVIFLHVNSLATKEAINLRVIDGLSVTAQSQKWEWILSLRQDGSHICGASLIAPSWAVTASHCIFSYELLTPANTLSVMSGSYDINSNETIVAVKRVIKHPFYDETTVNNDIALLELSSPISDVKAIAVDRKSALEVNSESWVAGWGNMSTTSSDTSDFPDNLMEVDLKIIDFDLCSYNYASDGVSLTSNMFCSGYMDGSKDSCQGDSGGPLIIPNGSSYELAGIVSFGGSNEQSCGAPNFPGVYTKVQNYIQWIERHTGALEQNSPAELDLESILITHGSYAIDGSFGSYDFENVKSAFDWVYKTASGNLFQFQGSPSSDSDVFGWKAIGNIIMEPTWYMISLGSDIDGDGSMKFDWILISVNSNSAYKLAGIRADGTFEYSEKLDVNYKVTCSSVNFY